MSTDLPEVLAAIGDPAEIGILFSMSLVLPRNGQWHYPIFKIFLSCAKRCAAALAFLCLPDRP